MEVVVVMGSKSDWKIMQECSIILNQFNIKHECRVLSAHRTPEELKAFLLDSEKNGAKVFIAGAGGAAHLAGVVASSTTKPVLGVPLPAWSLDGLDSLLSTVQMPSGIPVATFAIGKAGAINAALFSIQILSVTNPELSKKMNDFRKEKAEAILNEKLTL